jgi:hypothetical protein
MLPEQSLNIVQSKKQIKPSLHESSDFQEDNRNSCTDDDQLVHANKQESSRKSSSDSNSSRKLSKSESFSHNSEFDFIQMKRKQFAVGKGNIMQTSSSSQHSNSEDDVRVCDELKKPVNKSSNIDNDNGPLSNEDVKLRNKENKVERNVLQKTL